MQKIPGKKIADQILDDLKAEIRDKQLKPKLGVLLVGDDQASHIYVSLKEKAAHDIGIQTDVRRLPNQISDDELIKIIKLWNADKNVHGILIQMPLPEGHDADRVIEAMDPKKDVDGFHPKHVADLYAGQAAILSPLHEGILRLIAATPAEPNHALAIILANSHTFADPLKYILEKAGAEVEVMLSKDKDDKKLRQADIIVVAVGQLNFLTGNGVKPGACIIDVGINKTTDNKVRGDFDSQSSENLDGWYSPVPGGVGPMTVALLMQNVVKVCRSQTSTL
ncbi:MAG TPA: bifunctional 5,10-methylenetetrahydrofolate dehydrogenase/5,10-methenyltetrahydrofolate cyclohydrolase [bacterium]|nr:MAG: Bifunctional protein FolD protein [Parcubacteria group bacterium ADurb.Bin192]HPN15114.1 bifunctional 5,10-methylenetetrahydrofolate dehydrogenase/5,10-methenyltetrahydrofolate cyclohydrolase [bacterium]